MTQESVIRGRYMGFEADTLQLYTGYVEPARVGAGEIVGIEAGHHRRGRAVGRGTMWGVLAGAPIGYTLAALNPCDYCPSARVGAVAGGIVGSVLGATTGLVIGSFRLYWLPVYP